MIGLVGGHQAGGAAGLPHRAVTTGLPAAVRVLCPPDAPVVGPGWHRSEGTGTGGHGMAYGLKRLRPGDRAVFVSATWRDAWQLRRLRRRVGLVVEVRYAVLPGLARPLTCVQLDRGCLRWLWRSLATVPPGRALSALPIELLARAGDLLEPLRWVAPLAPARMVVVRRPS